MQITVKHSSIVVDEYEAGMSPILERTFTIYDPLTHQGYIKGIDYNEETKRLIVPRGIDIGWLEYQLQCKAYTDTHCDPYLTFPEMIMVKYPPKNERQQETLQFMVGADPYRHNAYKSQLCVNNNTGEGKTWACITAACCLNMRAIVITAQINWLEQWKNRILEYTDLYNRDILMLTSSASINRILREGVPANCRFILASHSTIANYGKQCGWEAVGELFKIMQVGLKFYDEAHLYFDNMCKIDFYTNTFRTYYVSATLARSNKDEDIIFKYYIKNVPIITFFDPEVDPHTKYRAIIFNSQPTPQQITSCKNAYGLNRHAYTNYVVEQENFEYLLHIIMCEIVIPCAGKILMYIGTIAAIEKVKAWLEEHYPMFTYGVVNCEVTNSKKSQLDKHIILTTTKSAGAALDIKGLAKTIVLAEPFKSEVLARQTLGRTRDPDTEYIDIVDSGFFHTKKYYEHKLPIFDKYATECEEERYNVNALRAHADELTEYYASHPFPFVI